VVDRDYSASQQGVLPVRACSHLSYLVEAADQLDRTVARPTGDEVNVITRPYIRQRMYP
jgi:hypothetical protein